MKEWKQINGLEGFYEISNHGDVRSVDRIIKNRLYKGCTIKPLIGYGGYLVVQLRKKITKKISYVHRLVATHFCEYKENLVINHIDENKLNNYYKNLEFVTKSQNAIHSNKNAGFLTRKYTDNEIIKIRKLHSEGLSIYKISKLYKENSGTISNIVNNKTYKKITDGLQ